MAQSFSKKEIRQAKISARSALAAHERVSADTMICSRLESLDELRHASVVAAYASDGTEPDLTILLKKLIIEGRTVCLPRWNASDGAYEMAEAGPGFELVKGKWGMPEPPPAASAVGMDVLGKALWLVPGVAFDENCGRIGRGKGIYDRLLAAAGSFSAGVFYECQKCACVPMDEHDFRLNAVVTESAVYRAALQ